MPNKSELDAAAWRMKNDFYADADDALQKYNDYKLLTDAYIELTEASIDKKLIDACNLICEYVEENIAKDWQITLTMNSIESYLELTDDDGDDIDVPTADYKTSSLRNYCELSNEMDSI